MEFDLTVDLLESDSTVALFESDLTVALFESDLTVALFEFDLLEPDLIPDFFSALLLGPGLGSTKSETGSTKRTIAIGLTYIIHIACLIQYFRVIYILINLIIDYLPKLGLD